MLYIAEYNITMRRWIKITLKILGGFLLLIILLWVGGAIYITRNKEAVLKSILSQLNNNINGQISAGSMEPALLSGFPGVSVSLNKVLLRDSLWATHHRDLLRAGHINISLNVLSLLAGNTKINRIAINDAVIELYTDSGGYSNTSIFKSSAEVKKTSGKTPAIEIKNIDFNNVRFIVDNLKRFKRFDFAVKTLRGKIKYPSSGFTGDIRLNTRVNSFSFNTRRGSFLKDKILDGTLSFHYDRELKTIIIDPDKLSIGNDKFEIGAKIHFDQSAFSISIKADKILFRDVALLLAPNISSKLLRFTIDKPIAVNGRIVDDGKAVSTDPLINVSIKVKDATVTIPSGQLKNASFDGFFTNQHVGKSIGDENSIIKFQNLTANYYNAPIKAESFTITDLSRPVATGRVTAKFPLVNLNNSTGKDIFLLRSGTADVDLYCKADIDNFRFTKPELNGNVRITDADITYLPRNMHLVKSSLTLNFTQTDLNLRDSRFQLGKSILNMNCSIQNFLNLYYTAPEKIIVNLKMSSPQLYLDEFVPFLGPRNKIKKTKSGGNTIKEFTEQFGTVLEASKINLRLDVNKAIYNKFIAKNLSADIDMIGDGVFLQNIKVSHAGGTLNLTGNIKQMGTKNQFTLNSKISRVNVKEFFYAFENFGQNSITDKNLRGYLSARADVSGTITNTGSVVPRSINGKVIFNLKDAALIDFEPMRKAGKFAFANRNFSDIRIDNLDGTLDIAGEKIAISPMEINSSVLNMDVKGIYSLGAGTEIAMDIPLRNPKGDELLDKDKKKQTRMKGIVLHLKAIDSENGKVKIRWNKDH